MRVVLVGTPARRARLRSRLPDGMQIAGEAHSLREARTLDDSLAPAPVDAYLIAAPGPVLAMDDGGELEGSLVEPLTPRERQVLELVADGLPNRRIAERLDISDETVKFHLAAIFGKLGAVNRTDAVRRALRHGLVPL
jgi:DNA-binding CsgD family transcriptional regulator